MNIKPQKTLEEFINSKNNLGSAESFSSIGKKTAASGYAAAAQSLKYPANVPPLAAEDILTEGGSYEKFSFDIFLQKYKFSIFIICLLILIFIAFVVAYFLFGKKILSKRKDAASVQKQANSGQRVKNEHGGNTVNENAAFYQTNSGRGEENNLRTNAAYREQNQRARAAEEEYIDEQEQSGRNNKNAAEGKKTDRDKNKNLLKKIKEKKSGREKNVENNIEQEKEAAKEYLKHSAAFDVINRLNNLEKMSESNPADMENPFAADTSYINGGVGFIIAVDGIGADPILTSTVMNAALGGEYENFNNRGEEKNVSIEIVEENE